MRSRKDLVSRSVWRLSSWQAEQALAHDQRQPQPGQQPADLHRADVARLNAVAVAVNRTGHTALVGERAANVGATVNGRAGPARHVCQCGPAIVGEVVLQWVKTVQVIRLIERATVIAGQVVVIGGYAAHA